MNILFFLIEIIATFSEGFIWLLCGKRVFKSDINVFRILSASLLFTIVVAYLNSIKLVSQSTMAIVIIIYGILMYILFNKKIIYTLSFGATCMILQLAIEMLVICSVGIVTNNPNYIENILTASNIYRIELMIFLKVLMILLYFATRKLFDKIDYTIFKNPIYIIFNIVGMALILIVSSSIEKNDLKETKIAISLMFVAFLIIVGLIIYLANSLVNKQLQLKEKSYIDLKNGILEKDLKNINKLYIENAKNFHEFKHHLDVLNIMLGNGQYDKMKEYMSNLKPSNKYKPEFITENQIVNMVMNVKYNEIKEKDIDFKYDLEMLSVLNINDNDLCSLLSNLMDNAIEAAEKVDEGEISFSMKVPGDFAVLKLTNSCNEVNVNDLKTNKLGNHGWGLKVIDDIVSKYSGAIEREYKNNIFTTKIMLPFKATN